MKIGKISVSVIKRSVAEIKADAVIVPNPQTMAGYGGVFEVMLKAGCIPGCEALRNWHSLSTDFMRIGEVLVVDSGGSTCRYLAHVASVPEFGNGKRSNFAAVVLSVQSALEALNKKNVSSVNIPMMGTGQLGWLSPEQSARAIMIGISRFQKSGCSSEMTINICPMSDEHERAANSIVNGEPSAYEGIQDNLILEEQGEVTPPVAELETSLPDCYLASKLQRPPCKFPNPANSRFL